MHNLEKIVNSIHHRLLNCKTVYGVDTAISKAA